MKRKKTTLLSKWVVINVLEEIVLGTLLFSLKLLFSQDPEICIDWTICNRCHYDLY